MSKHEILVRPAQGKQPIKVTYDIPDDIDGAVKKWGHEVVYNRFRAALVVDIQGLCRSKATKEDGAAVPVADVQKALDAWQPGVKQRGKSAEEKAIEAFDKLSPEERDAVLAAVTAKRKK